MVEWHYLRAARDIVVFHLMEETTAIDTVHIQARRRADNIHTYAVSFVIEVRIDDGSLGNEGFVFSRLQRPRKSNARRVGGGVVDTRSFNPRGTPLEQVDRLLADVTALAETGELRKSDAKNLQDQLKLTRAALQKDRVRVAILSLNAFEVQLVSLTFRHRLDFDIALSLGFAAEALETWLEQGQ